jgi:hypothetical protein
MDRNGAGKEGGKRCRKGGGGQNGNRRSRVLKSRTNFVGGRLEKGQFSNRLWVAHTHQFRQHFRPNCVLPSKLRNERTTIVRRLLYFLQRQWETDDCTRTISLIHKGPIECRSEIHCRLCCIAIFLLVWWSVRIIEMLSTKANVNAFVILRRCKIRD